MSLQVQTPAAEPTAAPSFPSSGMSPAIQIMLDDRLFDRAKLIAKYMSEAEGFTPPHLLNKTGACFAVVTRSITWKLDPYAVAQCTYQTPGGKVGYEGKLCQAILENSGKLEGPVRFEHIGDWGKILGKFEIKKSDRGKDFAVPTWTRKDAEGLAVIVRAKVKGEVDLREWRFDLIQAFPLNSTLWATDPKTQICYTAVRRFGSVAAPGLFMGVPFDREDLHHNIGPDNARDVTPARPQRSDFTNDRTTETTTSTATETKPYEAAGADGEVKSFEHARDAVAFVLKQFEERKDAVQATFEHNAELLHRLDEEGEVEHAHAIRHDYARYAKLAAEAEKTQRAGNSDDDDGDESPILPLPAEGGDRNGWLKAVVAQIASADAAGIEKILAAVDKIEDLPAILQAEITKAVQKRRGKQPKKA